MKILLATDGSEFAREAVEQCCEIISKPEETNVEIISVADCDMIPVPADPIGAPAEYILELEEKAEESAAYARETILEKFKNSALAVESKAFFGEPKRAIVEEAEKW